MCRRCGETDKRGSAESRRRRRDRMLAGENGPGGNGTICACLWCGCLLGAHADTFTVTGLDGVLYVLEVAKLEQDRLEGNGSPYRMDNVVPACHPCNYGRHLRMIQIGLEVDIPTGCHYGPEDAPTTTEEEVA